MAFRVSDSLDTKRIDWAQRTLNWLNPLAKPKSIDWAQRPLRVSRMSTHMGLKFQRFRLGFGNWGVMVEVWGLGPRQ